MTSCTYSQNPLDFKIHIDPVVRVQRGLCAHVPCTFTVPTNVRLSRDTNGLWYRLGTDAGLRVASRENSNYYSNGRVSLIGNVTRGDCSLYIKEPWSEDEGFHVFRIEDIQMKFTYTHIQPYVHIMDLTDKPTISSTRLVDGKEVTMTCTSPGRCQNIARPRISWEGTMTGTRQVDYIITSEDGTRTFHSNITFTPRKSHDNSPLFCRVTFKQDFSTVEKQFLNVEYSPSVDITIEGVDTNSTTAVIVEDGDSVTLRCIVESNPNASITWYKEDMVIQPSMNDLIFIIQLINITESDAGRYQCSAINEHGVTNRNIEIIHRNEGSRDSFINSYGHIILPATIGAICLLLLVLLVFACWRKRQRKPSSIEVGATYTELRRSEITDTYEQLKPMTRANTTAVGTDVDAANDYENVHKQHR
ncbi:sialic acid-binding Ig-like lectin 13 isoform X2 [Dendrobates tinctorius]|uniref:sialic acid-binding Ig-like lectin 13 isoform X2 n=1 Tax=Dendrobates tinctorius TaxID=92724 RepID=UPI003CCA5B80